RAYGADRHRRPSVENERVERGIAVLDRKDELGAGVALGGGFDTRQELRDIGRILRIGRAADGEPHQRSLPGAPAAAPRSSREMSVSSAMSRSATMPTILSAMNGSSPVPGRRKSIASSVTV